MLRRLCRSLLVLALVLTLGAQTNSDDPRHYYRFVVEGIGEKQVEFSGKIEVDGKSRKYDHEVTPFEFQCEAATSLTGSFETLNPDRRIRLRAYIARRYRKRAIAKSKGQRIQFKWLGETGGHRLVIWSERPAA